MQTWNECVESRTQFVDWFALAGPASNTNEESITARLNKDTEIIFFTN